MTMTHGDTFASRELAAALESVAQAGAAREVAPFIAYRKEFVLNKPRPAGHCDEHVVSDAVEQDNARVIHERNEQRAAFDRRTIDAMRTIEGLIEEKRDANHQH